MVAPRWLICRRYLVLAVDLRNAGLESPRSSEIRVTHLDGDGAELGELDPAMTRQEVTRRLAEGQQCLLGWWGHELAHYRWETTAPASLPYLGRVLRPAPGDQIVVEIYTAARFRGRGIASVVMLTGMERARPAGVSRLVWLVAWWNRRSLALADQVGSRMVGSVGYWRLGTHRRYFATGDVSIELDGSFSIGVATAGSTEEHRRVAPLSGRRGGARLAASRPEEES
jgi:GNAT superfamily N-acetyltransferase